MIVTDSVVEALALENNLIKQRSPKYNILLRDDKNYPYLQLTTGERFPRVLVARRVERDGHVYAGPFLPAKLARRTMALTHRLFGIRSCNEVITGKRGRPCLEYDIQRCIAPCVDTICSEAEYGRAVEDTRLFLEGRTEELAGDLRARMAEAAAAERFEQAGQLRDAHAHGADAGGPPPEDGRARPVGARRVRAEARPGRRGRPDLPGARRPRRRPRGAGDRGRGEPADRRGRRGAAAIAQFYEATTAPPEVHVPVGARGGRGARGAARGARRPQGADRGAPARREARAARPGVAQRRAAYEARFNAETLGNYSALETLRAVLALPALPRRIDCFDISTIQGSETVASMVVCEDGRMKKAEYRKFKVTSDEVRGESEERETSTPRGFWTTSPR